MRRPPPTWRRLRPIYPGVFRSVVIGMVLWAVSLVGFRLPFVVPVWLKLLLEVVVVWFLWRGVKAARRAPSNHVRLFSAQELFANAFLVQAFILLLRTG
jgi:hypothetical protein